MADEQAIATTNQTEEQEQQPVSEEEVLSSPVLSVEGADQRYVDALDLLRDYTKQNSVIRRFFSLALNRNHIDAVTEVINLQTAEQHDNTQHTPTNLLTQLKEKLLDAKKPLNKTGALAKTINDIQTKNNISIIDIAELNQEINTAQIAATAGLACKTT